MRQKFPVNVGKTMDWLYAIGINVSFSSQVTIFQQTVAP